MFNKKYIIFVLLALLMVSVTIAAFLSKRKSNNTTNSIVQGQSKALGVVSAPDNSLVYYDKDTKSFYKITDKVKKELFKSPFEPFALSYSKDRTKVLLIGDAADMSRPILSVDLTNQKSVSLNPNIINASFSPDGTKIVYHLNSAQKRTSVFYTADTDGQNESAIYSLPYQENITYLTRWPADQVIYALPVYEEIVAIPIIKINPLTKTAENIGSGKYTDIKPSPDGKNIATTVYQKNDIDFSKLSEGSNENISFGNYFIHLITEKGSDLDTKIEADLSTVVWNNEGTEFYAYGKRNDKTALYKVGTDGSVSVATENIPANSVITELALSFDQKSILTVNNGTFASYSIK